MKAFVVRFALVLALVLFASYAVEASPGVEEATVVEVAGECAAGEAVESELFTPEGRSVDHQYCQQWTGCGFMTSHPWQQTTSYCDGKCPAVCEDPNWGGYYSSSTGCCICEPDGPGNTW